MVLGGTGRNARVGYQCWYSLIKQQFESGFDEQHTTRCFKAPLLTRARRVSWRRAVGAAALPAGPQGDVGPQDPRKGGPSRAREPLLARPHPFCILRSPYLYLRGSVLALVACFAERLAGLSCRTDGPGTGDAGDGDGGDAEPHP